MCSPWSVTQDVGCDACGSDPCTCGLSIGVKARETEWRSNVRKGPKQQSFRLPRQLVRDPEQEKRRKREQTHSRVVGIARQKVVDILVAEFPDNNIDVDILDEIIEEWVRIYSNSLGNLIQTLFSVDYPNSNPTIMRFTAFVVAEISMVIYARKTSFAEFSNSSSPWKDIQLFRGLYMTQEIENGVERESLESMLESMYDESQLGFHIVRLLIDMRSKLDEWPASNVIPEMEQIWSSVHPALGKRPYNYDTLDQRPVRDKKILIKLWRSGLLIHLTMGKALTALSMGYRASPISQPLVYEHYENSYAIFDAFVPNSQDSVQDQTALRNHITTCFDAIDRFNAAIEMHNSTVDDAEEVTAEDLTELFDALTI